MNVLNNKRIVFTSGTSSTYVTTEAGRFSKKPAEVTEADGQAVQETVTFSGDQSNHSVVSLNGNAPSGQITYSSLSSEDKADARRIMKDLNQKARLFARNDDGELVRVSPAGAKELLDGGREIEVVTRLASQSESKSSSSSTNAFQDHFFSPADRQHASRSSNRSSVKVEYTSSPIGEWDSVLWHDDEDFKGVEGTPKLPAPGEPVTISEQWESRWKTSSEENSGIFRLKNKSSADSGFQAYREALDN
jgi:hypothetical protein